MTIYGDCPDCGHSPRMCRGCADVARRALARDEIKVGDIVVAKPVDWNPDVVGKAFQVVDEQSGGGLYICEPRDTKLPQDAYLFYPEELILVGNLKEPVTTVEDNVDTSLYWTDGKNEVPAELTTIFTETFTIAGDGSISRTYWYRDSDAYARYHDGEDE